MCLNKLSKGIVSCAIDVFKRDGPVFRYTSSYEHTLQLRHSSLKSREGQKGMVVFGVSYPS